MDPLFLFALIFGVLIALYIVVWVVMSIFALTTFRQISKEIDQNFTAFGRRR